MYDADASSFHSLQCDLPIYLYFYIRITLQTSNDIVIMDQCVRVSLSRFNAIRRRRLKHKIQTNRIKMNAMHKTFVVAHTFIHYTDGKLHTTHSTQYTPYVLFKFKLLFKFVFRK